MTAPIPVCDHERPVVRPLAGLASAAASALIGSASYPPNPRNGSRVKYALPSSGSSGRISCRTSNAEVLTDQWFNASQLVGRDVASSLDFDVAGGLAVPVAECQIGRGR